MRDISNRFFKSDRSDPCNSDLARHATRFYWQFSIGPHLGYEATCIANKRSPRVKNNDIVTDHYAAGHNDYYRSLLLTSLLSSRPPS